MRTLPMVLEETKVLSHQNVHRLCLCITMLLKLDEYKTKGFSFLSLQQTTALVPTSPRQLGASPGGDLKAWIPVTGMMLTTLLR